MAVNAIKVTQIPTNQKAETGAAAPINAVRIYQASMLAAKNNAVEAGFADDGTTSIPLPGTAYDGTWTNLKSINPIVNKIGSGALYQITVTYADQSVEAGGQDAINPLLRDPVYNETGQPTTFEVDRASNGDLLENSAGQVLTVAVQHADLYVSATVNSASNLDWTGYFTRTNSGSYTLHGKSYAAHQVLLSHVDKVFTEEEFEGEVLQFYQYTFHFYIRFARGDDDHDDWKFKILDRGTVEKRADGSGVDAITDDESNIITEPTNLDGSGKTIAPGATPWWLDGTTAFSTDATARVQMYKTADFSGLPV